MVTATNKLVVFTGFSGAGKDTIAAELRKHGYTSVVPHTTREMRENEIEGDPYYYISDSEFDAMAEYGEFAEYNHYITQFNGIEQVAKYGTAIASIDSSKLQVLTCGVQSTIRLKKTGIPAVMVFLHVPDDIREERAKARGSFDQIEWDNRLEQDIAFRNSSDYKEHVDILLTNTGNIADVVSKLLEALKGA